MSREKDERESGAKSKRDRSTGSGKGARRSSISTASPPPPQTHEDGRIRFASNTPYEDVLLRCVTTTTSMLCENRNRLLVFSLWHAAVYSSIVSIGFAFARGFNFHMAIISSPILSTTLIYQQGI